MLLAIDSGNTNIVFAVFDDADKIRGEWRSSSHSERTADDFGVWLGQLMGDVGLIPDDITGAIIASVVPATLFTLKSLCRDHFHSEPLVIGERGVDLDLKALVNRPQDVGADRLVNAVSAHQNYGGPLIVVDFGTATTFDVVAEDGAYVGGVIAPGVNLSLEALHMGAAALPHVDISRPDKVIGTNTVQCIQSGVFWGYVGLVTGITERIRKEYARPMRIIGTGGLAPLFAQGDMLFDTLEDDLTMHGLTVIHAYNKENGIAHEQ